VVHPKDLIYTYIGHFDWPISKKKIFWNALFISTHADIFSTIVFLELVPTSYWAPKLLKVPATDSHPGVQGSKLITCYLSGF
jgi:hypothetical protein